MRNFIVVIVCSLLLVSCPQPEPQRVTTSDPVDLQAADQVQPERPVAARAEEGEDEITVALGSDLPDEHHFALLVICNYELDGYQAALRPLSASDPVAAIALAANYGETAPAVEFFTASPPGQRIGDILGAVFGLTCTKRVPADLWTAIIERTEETELSELLWGLAQLDIEPGGPLARAGSLEAELTRLKAEALAADDTYRLGALDAILGSVNQEIDWPRYVAYTAEAHWNHTQWAALLRWAPDSVWHEVIRQSTAHPVIAKVVAQAAARSAPPGVYLAGSDAMLISEGFGLENRVLQFVNGKTETMDLAELAELTGADQLEPPESAEEERFRQQALAIALNEVQIMLDYAVIHHDTQLVQRVLDALPYLTEAQLNALLATIMRRNPAVLTEAQVEQLVALEDRAASFFLLRGWFDRTAVQNSDAVLLVERSPSHENALIAEGYRLWLAANTP